MAHYTKRYAKTASFMMADMELCITFAATIGPWIVEKESMMIPLFLHLVVFINMVFIPLVRVVKPLSTR